MGPIGLARLVASGTLSQTSTFEVQGAGLRPLNYRFDDGTRRTGRDVSLDFDWRAGRVRGTAEDEPVDLPAPSGLQDAASIQALVMLWIAAKVQSASAPSATRSERTRNA